MEANSQTARTDEITGERTFPEVEQAAVVAINPKTGEVLAMVNLPTFDNNRFQTEVPVDYYLGLARNEYTPLVNHAISGTYPPGSTFKLVPAAAALRRRRLAGALPVRPRHDRDPQPLRAQRPRPRAAFRLLEPGRPWL
jgi:cell division protein FtsI/penicillin-binding protein 2